MKEHLNSRVKSIIFILLGLALSTEINAQVTTMPMSPIWTDSIWNSMGYWFTAPADFDIVGLEVPVNPNDTAENQSVAVIRLNAIPPVAPTTVDVPNFTTLYLTQDNPTNGMIPVNIPITSGDIICILGGRDSWNSLGLSNYATSIGGIPITLDLMTNSWIISQVAPNFLSNVPGGGIGRIFMSYNMCNAPAIQVLNIGDVACNGDSTGMATASATGGQGPYSYVWSQGDLTAGVNNLWAGTFSVTVTDDLQCFKDTTITILEADSLSYSIQSTSVLCYGDANGQAQVMSGGGTGSHQYSWSSGANLNVTNNIPAGMYNVTITDSLGCTKVAMATIESPDSLFVVFDSVRNVVCEGDSDGYIGIAATGGTWPYQYAWNGDAPGSFNFRDNLPSGIHSFEITDDHGCTQIVDTALTFEHNAPVVDLGGTVLTTNSFADLTPGPHFATYNWSNGSNQSQTRVFEQGSYWVEVTDTNGCTGIGYVDVMFSVGIENVAALSNLISVFPNPSSGSFNVRNNGVHPVEFWIYDVTGRLVQTGLLPAQMLTALEKEFTAKGMHLIRFQNTITGETTTERLLSQ